MKKLGKYEILGELGHGAMGVVYRARDPFINRLVALKTITTGVADDPAMLQRFYREAQSAGGLQHPNIVTIYDMGEAGGLPYIAMELVEGENLDQLIARRTPLPLTLKLAYAMQACRAFDFAHKRGIVHRDIKPGNVMLSKDGVVKVVDFGIARVLETSKTQTGMLIGTFAYMSPEQYHGEHADERSDIWSFGVLFFELLCYQRPFGGPTPASLMHAICNENPSPLSKFVPECPRELEAIITKTLQKSTSERYQTMEDLLLELEPVTRKLQSQFVVDLVGQSQLLVDQGEFAQARDLLRQALQVESGNQQARVLLEKTNAELKRLQNRPKAQQLVEKGQALLGEKKIREAKAAVENALQLDSTYQAAHDLERAILNKLDRARVLGEWLEAAKQNLVGGQLEESEALLAKVQAEEPEYPQATELQQQITREKSERERRRRLQENLRQARELWTRQNYDECVELLLDLGKKFPDEEEIPRLLETVREDQAEQQKQKGLLESRNLLAAGRYEECLALLRSLREQFPRDDEIPELLEDVRKEQMNQRRLQGLSEARSVLEYGQFDACISLLNTLRNDFPDEPEIPRLLEAAKQNQVEQHRQQGLSGARKLLTERRHEECLASLSELGKEFPGDTEILGLMDAVRERQAEQRLQKRLEEARNLLAARHFDEAITLLGKLEKEFPANKEILKLQTMVRDDQAKQRKLGGLAEARKLVSSKNFEKSLALLADLRKDFPEDDEIRKFLESVRKEEADERKRAGLAHGRSLLAAGKYEESIALLSKLQAGFPGESEINKLVTAAREDLAEQQKQQKLAEARSLLAAQSFAEALKSLEALAADHPKDSSVLKLRSLVQREQEKHDKAQRIQSELDALKRLMSERKYPEVIARVKELLTEFPAEPNFVRLGEFAMSQQATIEKEILFRKSIEDAKSLFDAGQFTDAIRVAEAGLRSFPGNQELINLCQQAEVQQKKLHVRQQIERRIREIKVKINREKFSDAIELAKETLVTMGPDTDLTQLLNSAQVEIEAREKKRLQEETLQSIRTLMESGDIEAAGRTLDGAVQARTLETFDPQIQRLSEEIQAAKMSPAEKPARVAPSVSPALSKEYAFFQVAPTPSAAPTQESAPAAEASTPQAAAGQPAVLPDPVAQPPMVPEVVTPLPEIVAQAASPAVDEELGPTIASPDVSVTEREVQKKPPLVVQPSPPAFIEEPTPAAAAPAVVARPRELSSHEEKKQPPVPVRPIPVIPYREEHPATVPLWRKPAVMGVLAVVLIAGVGIGVKSLLVKPVLEEKPPGKTERQPTQPQVDPLMVQQQGALNTADKLIAANDLDGALRALQQAASLKGPLAPEIEKKIAGIVESKQDANLRGLRQREATLWQQGMSNFDKGRYTQAQKDMGQILGLPLGGFHRDDAQNYRDKIIPQHILQNNFVAQARQALRQEDFRSARQSANQLKQNGGDPAELLGEINKQEQGRLAQLENQFNQLKQQDDESGLQQLKALQLKFQALANDSGPQSGEASNFANSIPGAIADAQASIQRKNADAAFQHTVQKYQQSLNSNDKGALTAARNELQGVIQNAGPHAAEAQKYRGEIDNKIAALNQPVVSPPPPPVKAEPPPPVKVNNEGDIRAVMQRYTQAFEQRDADALRRVWPGMGEKYGRYKKSFESASSIRFQLSIQSIEFGADGSTAVVKGQVSQIFTPKGGKPLPADNRPAAIHLVKADLGTWVVSDVQ